MKVWFYSYFKHCLLINNNFEQVCSTTTSWAVMLPTETSVSPSCVLDPLMCHTCLAFSSHWKVQGRKRICPCAICGHILLLSLSVVSLWYGLPSTIVPCTVYPSPSILSCCRCIQSCHIICTVWYQYILLLGNILSGNYPSLEQNYNFVNCQVIWRVVKFKNVLFRVSNMSCILHSHNFLLSC
jgi:hypothetical protein